jgi:hypothetical protein
MKVPVQSGPTCWFHATLFHLISVPEIRTQLIKKMNEYIKALPDSRREKFYEYPNSNAPTTYNLYRYLWHILHESGPTKIPSNRLIHAAFKKYNFNLSTHSHSGTHTFIPLLCHRLGLNVQFVSNVSKNPPEKNVVIYTRKNIHESRGNHTNDSFELLLGSPVPSTYKVHSHLMSVRGPHKKPHAIVGFYMNNKPYIADSHYSRLLPIDFTNSEEVLSFYSQLGVNKVVYKNILYTKR